MHQSNNFPKGQAQQTPLGLINKSTMAGIHRHQIQLSAYQLTAVVLYWLISMVLHLALKCTNIDEDLSFVQQHPAFVLNRVA
jgi:hypothetical protein